MHQGKTKRQTVKETHKRSLPPPAIIPDPPPQTASFHPNNDAEIGRLFRQLMDTMQRTQDSNGTAPNPQTLLRSHTDSRYQVGDMPWVITSENVRTLDASHWTDEQQKYFLEYANLVMEESRRCMLLVAEITPDVVRDDLLERLGRNADLLWRTYKVASSVAPIEYVRDIDLAEKCRKL